VIGDARTDRFTAVRFGGRPAATHRLICLPYAGGGASMYREWPALFPDWLEIVALRLPGREARIEETPLRSVPEMVDELIDPLASLGAEAAGSYSLFGHSLGAITSFELAREVRRRGHPAPRHLFVSGRCAPHIPHGVAEISDLPDPEFLDAIGGMGGMPVDTFAASGLLDLLLPSLRADFVAAEGYRYAPGPPLDVPISAFGGEDDETVSRRQVEAWGEQTIAAFRPRMMPGDHFFLQPQRGPLAAAIRADIEADGA
jgi:medium-chain acyl-[acyl-carrier-protein] hydrolase